MKKYHFLLIAFLLLGIGAMKAQYNVLLNFDSANGEHPYGSLTLYANKLYGMTEYGGVNGLGCIFRIDTDGSGYKDLLDFDSANGAYPTGDLTISGNKIYGMTPVIAGKYDTGCIFSLDTNGSGFRILYNIGGTIGAFPSYGGLTLSGKMLYGMTITGGPSSYGNIFGIDTNGSSYKDLYDFNLATGYFPLGSLTYNAGKLYGVTIGGDTTHYDYGNIFSIDTDGGHFAVMHNFNDMDGAYPIGTLRISGNLLYGMTEHGDSNGCIFSIDINGTRYKLLHNFLFSGGGFPTSSLTISGAKMYGFANGGGGINDGCIFRIDTSGNGYLPIFNFDGVNGGGPPGGGGTHWASLVQSGNNLYGMTLNGGIDDEGVIFSLNSQTAGVDDIISSTGAINLYPNPNNGVFTIQDKSEELRANSAVEIYNILGEKVYASPFSIHNSTLTINISNQPAGAYLYRVLNADGRLVGEGKIVIEH